MQSFRRIFEKGNAAVTSRNIKVWRAMRASDGAASKPLDFHVTPNTLDLRTEISNVFIYDHGTLNAVPDYAFFNKIGYPVKKKTSLGHYMTIHGGITVVSADLKKVLELFELGATRFYPLPLYEYDQKTRRSDELYVMQVAEAKDTLVPEHSDHLEPVGQSEFFRPKLHSEVALREDTCTGADLWRERRMRRDWYFSDRLHAALMKSGLLARKPAVLTFTPCKIIE